MSRVVTTPDPLLDATDLQRRLGSKNTQPSTRTIEGWRRTGDGPAFVKIGRRVFYKESAVEAWLTQRTRTHTNEEK